MRTIKGNITSEPAQLRWTAAVEITIGDDTVRLGVVGGPSVLLKLCGNNSYLVSMFSRGESMRFKADLLKPNELVPVKLVPETEGG